MSGKQQRVMLLLALGCLLTQLAWAQQPLLAPLVPVRAAVAVPETARTKPEKPRNNPLSTKIVCRLSGSPGPQALMLLNSRIIVGPRVLAQLNPQRIAAVRVYKDARELPGWPPFTSAVGGLLDITIQKNLRVPSVPLSRLKRRLHVAGPVQYEQYGQLLPAAQLRIAKADIRAATVRVVGPGETRIQLADNVLPAAQEGPAGTAPRVRIRGLARR